MSADGPGLATEILGWACSTLLVVTLSRQIYKQWKERQSGGVSKWLYIGQLGSEVGFVAYSFLVKNWVFVVTNTLLLVANLVGLGITLHHQRSRDGA